MCGAPDNRATQMSLTLTLSRQRERELEGEKSIASRRSFDFAQDDTKKDALRAT
jgi:hypothetical protein